MQMQKIQTIRNKYEYEYDNTYLVHTWRYEEL